MDHSVNKVLIMTCSHGSGHKMIAQTLQAEYERQGCQVLTFDIIREFSKVINIGLEKLYLKSYGIGNAIYRKIYYDQEENIQKDFRKVEWYWPFLEETTLDIIHDFKPDLIVNTYSYRIVPILKAEHFSDIPVLSVVTEYCAPDFWIHPDTDRYYVACEAGKERLMQVGTPQERIRVSGIPVREAFYLPQDREKLYFKYGLDPTKVTCILFAGTYGVLKKVDHICEGLSYVDNIQTIVICGNNRRLRHQLVSYNFKGIKVMGYVADIQELYALADIMITKPGGTVLSEIVATKVPLILYDPAGGQELENAKIFEKNGAALIANTPEEVFYHVIHLKSYPKQLNVLRENLEKMDYGDATRTIVEDSLAFASGYHSDRKTEE